MQTCTEDKVQKEGNGFASDYWCDYGFTPLIYFRNEKPLNNYLRLKFPALHSRALRILALFLNLIVNCGLITYALLPTFYSIH